jgi:hypothetical protein
MGGMNAQELIGRLRDIDPARQVTIVGGKLVAQPADGPALESAVVVWDPTVVRAGD